MATINREEQNPKIIKFLMIPDSNPWNKIFYMCGNCGHAIALSSVETHARVAHHGTGADLFETAFDANLPS